MEIIIILIAALFLLFFMAFVSACNDYADLYEKVLTLFITNSKALKFYTYCFCVVLIVFNFIPYYASETGYLLPWFIGMTSLLLMFESISFAVFRLIKSYHWFTLILVVLLACASIVLKNIDATIVAGNVALFLLASTIWPSPAALRLRSLLIKLVQAANTEIDEEEREKQLMAIFKEIESLFVEGILSSNIIEEVEKDLHKEKIENANK